MAIGALGSIATGVFAGGVGMQQHELKKEEKLEEIKWQMAAKMADHGISSWMKAYQENEIEARKGNQIKAAMVNNGINPAVVDHFYDMYGNEMAKPEYIEAMRRAEAIDITGQAGPAGVGSTPRSVKRSMPSIDTLQQPLKTLGMKDQQINDMLAPYRAMPTPQVNQSADPNRQYRVDLGPNNETREAATKAHQSVLSAIDRLTNPKEASDMFKAQKPANVPDAYWNKLAPNYAMDNNFWGDMEQRRKIADEARRKKAYEDADRLMRGGRETEAQAILAGPGGMGAGPASNMRAMPGGRMADPAHGAGITASPTSPSAVPTRQGPGGLEVGPAISLEGSGPPRELIVQAAKNMAANAATIQQLDITAEQLRQIPEATGVIGSVVEASGGLIAQIPGIGARIDKQLQEAGYDINKITGVRTQMYALVNRVGQSIQEDTSDRFSRDERLAANDIVRGLKPTASAGQTLEAWASLRRITNLSNARNAQIALPAPRDLTSPQAIESRLEGLMRFGLSEQMAFDIVMLERRQRGITGAPK